MLERQIKLARGIARFIANSADYDLLPAGIRNDQIYMVVLFRAKDEIWNRELVRRINDTRKIYVSGTTWDSQPAARFAIANWMVDVERDLKFVTHVLSEVAK